MRPGDWRPGHFPEWVTLAAKLSLLGAMAVVGVGYLVGGESSRSLSTVEAAAPLWVWGAIFLAGGVIGFVSIIMRWGRGVLAAHLIGLVVYLALAVGIVSDVIHTSDDGWDVLVSPALTLAMGGLLVVLVCRRSTWEHAELTTTGIAVTAALAVASIELDGVRSAFILLSVGSVHGLLAIGTASHLRQDKIIRDGRDPVEGVPV